MTERELLRMIVDLQERVRGLELAMAQHERIRHEKPTVRGPMSLYQRIGYSKTPATIDANSQEPPSAEEAGL